VATTPPEDCLQRGVELRSLRECRNAFITLTIANDPPEARVHRITHNASGDVLSGYLVNDWRAMCDAVLRLPAALPENHGTARVIQLAGGRA